MPNNYTCIDSFAGAGGLCLGLERAGYEIVLSFDNDPLCIETQKLNKKYFAHESYLANVENMLNGNLLRKAGISKGQLFLLAGGPPCQGFSIQRIGDDQDKRNVLVLKFVSMVKEVMPQYFLFENVPGIFGKRGYSILDSTLSKLEKMGYWIHKKILDAQDYKIPQRRKRFFIIGERKDRGDPHFEFPQPLNSNGKKITVREVIGHLPEPPLDGKDHFSIRHHRRDRISETNKERLRALKPGEGRDSLPRRLLARCHRRASSEIGHRSVYGRMKWDDVAPTITARFDSFTRGQFGHPEQLRSISLREGALLQTFPADFVFAGNKVDVARQIGNAVPPRLAEIMGKQIIKCHEKKAAAV